VEYGLKQQTDKSRLCDDGQIGNKDKRWLPVPVSLSLRKRYRQSAPVVVLRKSWSKVQLSLRTNSVRKCRMQRSDTSAYRFVVIKHYYALTINSTRVHHYSLSLNTSGEPGASWQVWTPTSHRGRYCKGRYGSCISGRQVKLCDPSANTGHIWPL